MAVRYQPPYQGETEPWQKEVHGEHQQSPTPLCVHQRRENILKRLHENIVSMKIWNCLIIQGAAE